MIYISTKSEHLASNLRFKLFSTCARRSGGRLAASPAPAVIPTVASVSLLSISHCTKGRAQETQCRGRETLYIPPSSLARSLRSPSGARRTRISTHPRHPKFFVGQEVSSLRDRQAHLPVVVMRRVSWLDARVEQLCRLGSPAGVC
jgi:hypothetical protein